MEEVDSLKLISLLRFTYALPGVGGREILSRVSKALPEDLRPGLSYQQIKLLHEGKDIFTKPYEIEPDEQALVSRKKLALSKLLSEMVIKQFLGEVKNFTSLSDKDCLDILNYAHVLAIRDAMGSVQNSEIEFFADLDSALNAARLLHCKKEFDLAIMAAKANSDPGKIFFYLTTALRSQRSEYNFKRFIVDQDFGLLIEDAIKNKCFDSIAMEISGFCREVSNWYNLSSVSHKSAKWLELGVFYLGLCSNQKDENVHISMARLQHNRGIFSYACQNDFHGAEKFLTDCLSVFNVHQNDPVCGALEKEVYSDLLRLYVCSPIRNREKAKFYHDRYERHKIKPLSYAWDSPDEVINEVLYEDFKNVMPNKNALYEKLEYVVSIQRIHNIRRKGFLYLDANSAFLQYFFLNTSDQPYLNAFLTRNFMFAPKMDSILDAVKVELCRFKKKREGRKA